MLADEEILEFQQRVAAELHEVETALADVEAGRATVALDQTSVGRLSRMDAMQQQAMANGVKERLLRQKSRLQAAAIRLSNHHFGNCCDCGGAIPVERLRADVAAPFCAYCQEEIDERRERA
jgi:DnaK suppressor protein